MKKLLIGIVAVILTSGLFAQSPEKMSYQSVIRNSSNQLVTNQLLGMQISILQGSTTGTAVYVEQHNPTSNMNGLVSLEIGNGTVITGDFSLIDWSHGPYFLKNETDLNGGTSYTITGTSQLLSVPYALHSRTTDFTSNIPDLSIPIPIFFKGKIIYVHPTINADSIFWGGHGTTIGTTSTTDGDSSTTQIVNILGPGDYAAYLCDTLTAFGFNDWYLPSVYELDAVKKQSYYLNLSDYNHHYWSSTEGSGTSARVVRLYDFGNPINSSKDNYNYYRCIRKN